MCIDENPTPAKMPVSMVGFERDDEVDFFTGIGDVVSPSSTAFAKRVRQLPMQRPATFLSPARSALVYKRTGCEDGEQSESSLENRPPPVEIDGGAGMTPGIESLGSARRSLWPLKPINREPGSSPRKPISRPCQKDSSICSEAEIRRIESRLLHFKDLKTVFEQDQAQLDEVEVQLSSKLSNLKDSDNPQEIDALFDREEGLLKRIKEYENDQIERDCEIVGLRQQISRLLGK